jgi:hypothetical protein
MQVSYDICGPLTVIFITIMQPVIPLPDSPHDAQGILPEK